MARTGYRIPTALTGRRRRPPLPAIVGPFGRLLGRPEEKAEYLGLCFERQFAPNPPMDWDFDEQVEMAMEGFLSLPITAEPEPISLGEVSDRLAELQPRKAAGRDGIMNTALRLLPEPGVQFLTDLFNACLRLAYFPKKW